MNKSYFLDTSYIIALEIANEDAHEQVLQNWLNSRPALKTLSGDVRTYVFDETVAPLLTVETFTVKRLKWKRLPESPDIELTEIDRDLFDRGWQY
jgi:hypothetical protein